MSQSTGDFPFLPAGRLAHRWGSVCTGCRDHCLDRGQKTARGRATHRRTGPGKERIVDARRCRSVQRQRQAHGRPGTSCGTVSTSKGWVRINLSAPTRYGAARRTFLERAQRLQVLVQIAPGSRKILVGGPAEPGLPHRKPLINSSCLSAKCLINGGRSVSTRLRTSGIDRPQVNNRLVELRRGYVIALLVELVGEGVELAKKIRSESAALSRWR